MDSQSLHIFPHLTTTSLRPLESLETHLLAHQAKIEQWLRLQWQNTPAPFYTSVDLRNAGFKLAPVDTNLFPAGFNNLNPTTLPLCVQAVQSVIERLNVAARRVLLIPENHTRNFYYLESVATLRDILQKAGYEVRIGSILPDLKASKALTLPSGQNLLLEPLIRKNNCVTVKGFTPCLILLNNDLSLGSPSILENIHQKIVPPLHVGWSTRLKSNHFTFYKKVAQEFSEQIGIDHWLIDPLFKNCGEIDFMKKGGYECLADNVGVLLNAIQNKYTEYDVPYQPFVIIKADAGSYGMGVMTVHSAEEISDLNRKQRTRMSATKEGKSIRRVILQEGVYTFETLGANNAVAEPVVYMIDHFVVGGFYRVHTTRGINENLNAPGMHFEPIPFADSCITPDQNMAPDACPNRFYAYGVIARLALLAAARELNE
ncbi:glutamate--cysteine ligase [Candidatus Parabeggiatoa sp. HSG14]|uniref:glutamate--cysteine ligase n=1 Tax=Candidatus Parabeggiatoa sp. HSG14 TaxID=3055593 RepID=UPI0025A715E8|nr:glutamate--cysteine ligase [Thiotrichales bacterium HSG14]